MPPVSLVRARTCQRHRPCTSPCRSGRIEAFGRRNCRPIHVHERACGDRSSRWPRSCGATSHRRRKRSSADVHDPCFRVGGRERPSPRHASSERVIGCRRSSQVVKPDPATVRRVTWYWRQACNCKLPLTPCDSVPGIMTFVAPGSFGSPSSKVSLTPVRLVEVRELSTLPRDEGVIGSAHAVGLVLSQNRRQHSP